VACGAAATSSADPWVSPPADAAARRSTYGRASNFARPTRPRVGPDSAQTGVAPTHLGREPRAVLQAARVQRRVVQPQAEQLDTRPDRQVARAAADAWGVLSYAELRACGLSHNGVWVRVRSGRLHPIHRGVYAVGHPAVPLLGRFSAAVKACGPGAVLSHFSAAVVLGLVRWDDRHVEVTVPRSGTRRHAGVRVHRTRMLARGDVVRRSGLPVTSPARTLLDLAATFEPAPLRRLVREAHALGLVVGGELAAGLARTGPRRGAAKLGRILAVGPAPTRSVLEDVVMELIASGGLLRPDVNVPLILGGRRVVPDFRWPAQRLVVEADGAAWHDHRLAREDDAERQALLEAHGERVVRVTWRQAVTRRAETLARLRAAGAPRR
jgi:hypothetical protein